MGNPSHVETPPQLIRAMPYAEAREQAIAILTNRYAEDSLSEAEFEWWLARLSEADTAPRVEALIDRLSMPPMVAYATGGPPIQAPQAGKISAFMSEAKRTGPWTVPHHLMVRGVMCEVKIDFRQARIPYPCVVDVSAIMASVRITMPPGVAVDFDMSSVMASVQNDSGERHAHEPSAPRIVIRGRAIMAEVKVVVKAPREYDSRPLLR